MYRDLLPLVVPGFLSARLQFGGLSLGVRSLSGNDLQLLRAVAKEGAPEWTIQVAAASIWMIDGLPLLESHPYTMKVAYDLLRDSHTGVLRGVFSQVLSFFQRMKVANKVFESFLYEDESRKLWRATNNGTFPIYTQAGIPGVDRLGSNIFQNAWVQWNRAEDDRQDDDYQWSLTKVLVSVQSSKSAKKLDSKDKTRQGNERNRRTQVQDETFYRYIGLISEDDPKNKNSPHYVFQPRSAQELGEQMRRWVAGEMDLHDRVVEEYKNRARQKYEKEQQDKEDAIVRARERRALEERVSGGVKKPALVGYTPDQLRELRPSAVSKPGARFITEGNLTSKLYNRYLREGNQSRLNVRDGKVVYQEASTSPSESGASLNDRIARRTPRIDG